MTRKRMFRKGTPYESIQDFVADYLNRDSVRYVYFRHKLMHFNFAAAMHLSSLCLCISQGIIYRAVWNEENK